MRSWRASRRTGGACTMICFSVFIAVVRAFMAVSRVILSWRIISTAPSAVLGMAVDCPASRGPRRHLGVDGVGLAGGAACTAVAPIHFHDMMPGSVDGPCQASAVAPGAFDPERLNPPVCLGPRDQSLVATRVRDERVIAQTDPPAVDCHRDVDMRMRINTDDHRPRFGRRSYAVGHGLASSDCGPELVRVGGQDCDGPWVQQAPIGSRPSGQLAAVRVASGR